MSLPAADVLCPYCGESIQLLVDDSGGSQSYIEDCSVCCRPIEVSVQAGADGTARVTVAAENE